MTEATDQTPPVPGTRTTRSWSQATVADAMTTPVVTCVSGTPLIGLAAKMVIRRVHAVVVASDPEDPLAWRIVSDLAVTAAGSGSALTAGDLGCTTVRGGGVGLATRPRGAFSCTSAGRQDPRGELTEPASIFFVPGPGRAPSIVDPAGRPPSRGRRSRRAGEGLAVTPVPGASAPMALV